MSKRTTISDIAKAMGVAPSTVYKALSGNKGVNDKNREKIQQVAENLGYVTKSSKVKGACKNVVALFPDPAIYDYEFYAFIWSGIRKRASELSLFGLKVTEFTFNGTTEDQLRILNELLANQKEETGDKIDGIVTLVWDENFFLEVIDDFDKLGIPFFTINSDAPSSLRVAAVQTNSYQTGRLAAEYLGSVIPEDGTVIITGTKRNAVSHEKTTRGFIDQMAITNPDIQVIELYENQKSPNNLMETIKNMLDSVPNIRGLYANNARTTSLIGKLLFHNSHKNKLKIVGSEVSKDAVFYLNNGVFNALIDEQPYTQGYQCISIVYDFVCKSLPVKQTNYVSLNLVLQNNLPTNM